MLAGKHMVPHSAVQILGRPAFHDLSLVTTGDLGYLGTQWRSGAGMPGGGQPLKGNLSARTLIFGVQGADPARRDRLLQLLDIDLEWTMLSASDGQRRRVQIAMGLLLPYKVTGTVPGGNGGGLVWCRGNDVTATWWTSP